MKYIISESQFNPELYSSFVDMLVDKTEIFGGEKNEYRDYNYTALIQYPFYDNPFNVLFNSPENLTFTVPGRYNMKTWLMFINIDMDETPKLAEEVWRLYIDKVEVKVKDYIKKFLD